MKNYEPNLKTTVSCRIDHPVKEELTEEAAALQVTVSNYVETILKNRDKEIIEDRELHNDIIVNEQESEIALLQNELDEKDCMIDRLTEIQSEYDTNVKENYQLEKEIKILKKKNQLLSKQNINLEKLTQKAIGHLETAAQKSIQFDESDLEEINSLADQLKDYYPESNLQEMIIASLNTALKNEKSFLFIHTLKPQLKN